MSEQIFVSYRRDGGDITAKLICEALKNLGYTVFYDYDSLNGGYFDSRILDSIEGCNDFVLVLPPDSLDRCVNEDDWVRQEIRHALKHKKNIIPILLPGFAFPKNMPADIADIARFNGVQFVMAYFDGVIDAVVDRLTTEVPRKSAPAAKQAAPERKASEGLAFERNKEGTGYIVKLGTCTDADIVIPRVYNGKSVTAIGESAFKGYASLSSITIPNSVTTIDEQAFYGCSLLTSIKLPDSVTTIGKWAFEDCTSLESITIPKNVTSVGARAFLNCQALVNIEVAPGNNFYCSLDGHLYTKNLKMLVSYAIGRKDTSYVLPEGVTKIEDSAFSRCTYLESVTVPDGVTSMGAFVFYHCASLTSITLPNSITSMEEGVFSGCSLLQNISIPNSVTSIGKNAFRNCATLTDITIPNNTTGIDESAFSGCTLLKSITLSNSVTSLGPWVFQDCTSLTGITIPKNVASIGARVFLDCQALASIEVDPENQYYCSRDGHLYTKDLNTLVSYAIGCRNASYAVPEGVTRIEDSAFSRCAHIRNVTLSNTVTTLGEYAFYRCASLKNITLPNSVTSIEKWAFQDCTSLEAVTLPNRLTSIEQSVFNGCSSLTSITIPNSVTSIEKWAFQDCTSLEGIAIPRSVTNIAARAFLNCESLSSFKVSFWNRAYRSVGGHLYTKNLQTVVSYAIGCREPSYIIPESVTKIEDSAFSRCTHLKSITIPSGLTSIGEYAFHRCTSINSIRYTGSVEMWKNISIETNSFNKVPATAIRCSNGNLPL